jgi:hypothetical protein
MTGLDVRSLEHSICAKPCYPHPALQDPGKIGFGLNQTTRLRRSYQFRQVAKDSDSGSSFPRGLIVLFGIRELKCAARCGLRLQIM